MLLDGINHVAVLTNDTERLHAFYREVFDATVSHDDVAGSPASASRSSTSGRTPSSTCSRSTATPRPSTRRRCSVAAVSITWACTRRRSTRSTRFASGLMARGATDGFVTDFGPILSLFFVDPDGLEGEVCVVNPDRKPGVVNPPGTPAARYQA